MQKGPKISRSADNTKDEGNLEVDSHAGSENTAHTSVWILRAWSSRGTGSVEEQEVHRYTHNKSMQWRNSEAGQTSVKEGA